MPIEILMPALSPTMEEGTLAKWLVKEGDTVSSGDIIAEIETDKATMEFEAVDEGTIGKIIVPEGSDGVKVNALIAVLLEDGEEASDAVLSSAPADDAGDKAAATAVTAEPQLPHAEPSTAPAPAAPAASDGTRIFASPLARRIAADTGLIFLPLMAQAPWPHCEGRCFGRRRCPCETRTRSGPTVSAATPAPAPSISADAIAKIYADREFKKSHWMACAKQLPHV